MYLLFRLQVQVVFEQNCVTDIRVAIYTRRIITHLTEQDTLSSWRHWRHRPAEVFGCEGRREMPERRKEVDLNGIQTSSTVRMQKDAYMRQLTSGDLISMQRSRSHSLFFFSLSLSFWLSLTWQLISKSFTRDLESGLEIAIG